jgi:hypothetical protein
MTSQVADFEAQSSHEISIDSPHEVDANAFFAQTFTEKIFRNLQKTLFIKPKLRKPSFFFQKLKKQRKLSRIPKTERAKTETFRGNRKLQHGPKGKERSRVAKSSQIRQIIFKYFVKCRGN